MISVVMPAYNSADFIREAIESVLNQTYPHFELIVIDDGSSDNTVQIVEEYQARDPRVKLIKQQNAGVGAARNVGISTAQHPWIALMDSDDIALPERFEKQIAAIEANPDVVMWSSETRNMSDTGQARQESKYGGPTSREEFNDLRRRGQMIYLATTAAIFRKDIAEQIGGFDPRFRSAGDTEFWDRMAAHGPTLALAEPLVLYRLHRQGIMAKRFAELYRNTQYLEKRARERVAGNELDFEHFIKDFAAQSGLKRLLRDADMRSQLHYRIAGTYISAKQYLPGLFQLGLAFIFNPRLIFQRIWRRLTAKRSA